MALSFTEDFHPALIVYDCMDELSAFKFAPPELTQLEEEMFRKADLVFTGGQSLFEHKRNRHHNIYPLPSSIDKEHFARARHLDNDPGDQREIPHPRFGYYGVIDERFDAELIGKIAADRLGWHFIFIGPIVKIDPALLPQLSNIYYLGGKTYEELPSYVAGWDVALIPFARNESTRFISPTKTPEYLAAGKPVISTSIKDVVDPYGINGLVKIADTSDEFINAAESILTNGLGEKWLRNVDHFLAGNSWDKTWTSMLELIKITLDERNKLSTPKKQHYV
jgi:glycosyltransferase involved in cell wall biosynthesis